MSIVDELHEAAMKVECFYAHGAAARLMREAAEKLKELMPVEVPVENVAQIGEE